MDIWRDGEEGDSLPRHHCGECTHVRRADDEFCDSCHGVRPLAGWPPISEGFDPWLGRLLDGRYLVVQRVGQGAMSKVYRAQSRAISRAFAVKITDFRDSPTGIEPEQVRARLDREIATTSALRNPHVVPPYEYFELSDHIVAVVMDFVNGTTLQRTVEQGGPLDPRRALQILRQVCNGVHEAHEAGLIHRDLKPANIMVEPLPAGDDFVHVLDFGIVRVATGVSNTQGFLGTPLYTSPEQAGSKELDRRSDIYSLGATLFFLLTGRPPFVSDNAYAVLRSHVHDSPPTLAAASGGHGFVPRLEGLVAEMLAKRAAERPETLSRVIERIDALLAVELGAAAARLSTEFTPDNSIDTDNGNDAPAVGDSVGLGLSESSSVFESEERDLTGPKAVIFRRGPSRGTVRQLINVEKRDRRTDYDRVYRSNTGAYRLPLDVPSNVSRAACSEDGELILADDDGNITLARHGRPPRTVDRVESLTAMAVTADHAVVGTANGRIYRLHDRRKLLFRVRGKAGRHITSLALGPGGRVWLAGTEAGQVFKCNPRESERSWVCTHKGPPVAAVAVAPDGDLFAIGRSHGEVEIYSVARPADPYARFSIGSGTARSLTFSPDGHLLAVLFDDCTVAVHRSPTGARLHTLRDEQNELLTISFQGDELLGYFHVDGRVHARQMENAAVIGVD